MAISSEDRAEVSKLKHELAVSFPILSDTDRAVIERYSVFHENEPKGRPIARPSAFIIDPKGIIRSSGGDYRAGLKPRRSTK